MGVNNNKQDDLGFVDQGKWGQNSANSKAGGIAVDRWYAVKIEVRSGTFRCFVDNELQFNQTDPRFTHGQVRIRLWGVAARFRHIQVTDPNGKVLWEGLPPLPADPDPGTPSEVGNEILTLRGHTGRLRSVAFRPDGKQIVSGGKDTSLRCGVRAAAGNSAPSGGTALRSTAWLQPRWKTNRQRNLGAQKTIIVWDAESGREILLDPGAHRNGPVRGVQPRWEADRQRQR